MENQIKIQYYNSPFGELILGDFEGKLCLCDWRYRKQRKKIDNRIKKGLTSSFEELNSAIITETKNQLNSFFNKEIKQFTIPLLLIGSEFQKKVWNQLLTIPYGETNSYLQFSKLMDSPKAIRAVANANGANALSILIPCHRIIGNNGDLVGYSGGINAKKKLLDLEGALKNNQLQLF